MNLVMNDRWNVLLSTFGKFAITGVVNTLLTIAVIFALKFALSMGDASANVIGYSVGLASSFMLNRRWTFRHAGRIFPTLARFLIVFGIAYIINITVVIVLIEVGANSYLAHVAGMPLYTLIFYLGCRCFVFSRDNSYI